MKTHTQSKNDTKAADTDDAPLPVEEDKAVTSKAVISGDQKEYGGRSGPEPTRYGDWEKNGIISDF
ncbi:DUF1674 domain-containing protein [Kordiimonas aquimaris]|uniref:DUF1674 domain-containing protein n=1 Tax=Kordiimonas aquimaris TaxID=707591 RepID=UPI0021D3E9D1|nr:succinate dehydrogenase assembly factor 4 [Kordiimonas aquimaris]